MRLQRHAFGEQRRIETCRVADERSDTNDLPTWRTDWNEFEQWLDGLDFGHEEGNAHVTSISTPKGLYAVIVAPKKVAGKRHLWGSQAAE